MTCTAFSRTSFADPLCVEDGPQRPTDLVEEIDFLVFVQYLRRQAVELEPVCGPPGDEIAEEGDRLARPFAASHREAQPLPIDLNGGTGLPTEAGTRLLGASSAVSLYRLGLSRRSRIETEASIEQAAKLGPPGLGDDLTLLIHYEKRR